MLSSAAHISIISMICFLVLRTMKTPRRGTVRRKPSCSSSVIASRIGVRDTPSAWRQLALVEADLVRVRVDVRVHDRLLQRRVRLVAQADADADRRSGGSTAWAGCPCGCGVLQSVDMTLYPGLACLLTFADIPHTLRRISKEAQQTGRRSDGGTACVSRRVARLTRRDRTRIDACERRRRRPHGRRSHQTAKPRRPPARARSIARRRKPTAFSSSSMPSSSTASTRSSACPASRSPTSRASCRPRACA